MVDWVRHGSGSLHLIARAGCGKTFTLVRGVVRAVVENDLGEIALMAFNKSAANEFKDRLAVLASDTGDERFSNWKHVEAGTVHSFGFRAVRKWAPGVQLDDKKVFGILDELAEAEREQRMKDKGVRGMRAPVYEREAGPIRKLVSLAKQSAFGFITPLDDRHSWYELAIHHAVNEMTDDATLDEVIEASIEVLRESVRRDKQFVDFDDMVLAPLIHNIRMWPKDWVLIDEAQDTNASRRALALKMLKPVTGRLIAVGDDRQAIYGFTGADSDALDLIAAELDSETLPLTVTYRCPKSVVAEANRLVPDLDAHESAPQGRVMNWDAIQEGRPGDFVNGAPLTEARAVHWFEVGHGVESNHVALCRNTKPLIETAYAMLAAGVGCRVEGREIGEGLIKLATRWKRVRTLGALADKLVEYKDREVQKWNAKGREDRAQGVEDKVDALFVIIDSLVRDGKTGIEDLTDWVRHLFGDTPNGEMPSVFTLSTIHKSKGREWDRVYLLYRAETLPSAWARKPWQLHQEENLEYVAITRSKGELVYVN